MARPTSPFQINEAELQRLAEMVSAAPSRPALSVRAQVVLLSLEGLTLDTIMERTGLARASVVKWRERFREHGLVGLHDAPRSGRKRRLTNAQWEILSTHCFARTDPSVRNRSQAWVAEKADLSPSSVSRYYKILTVPFSGIPGMSWRTSLGSYPRSTGQFHQLLGVHLDRGVQAFAIGVRHTRVPGPVNFGSYPPSMRILFSDPFGAGLEDRLRGPRIHSEREDIEEDLASFRLGLAQHYKRVHIVVHLHIASDVANIISRLPTKWGRRISVHHASTHDAWMERFRTWLLLSLEELPDKGRWRDWEAYVEEQVAAVREFEVARVPAFTWFNPVGLEHRY